MNNVNHEGSHGCHEAAHGGQHLVERVLAGQFVIGLGAVPQATSAATDVPIGQVVDDEVFQLPAGLVVIPGHEAFVVGLGHRGQTGEDPTVQRRAFFDRQGLGVI